MHTKVSSESLQEGIVERCGRGVSSFKMDSKEI
jgi:hypothetical protein